VARGKTLGTDHRTDAGLMQITEVGPWPFVDLGDPGDCRLGDWVLALGHPSGYDPERPVLVRLGRVLSRTGEVLRTDCTLVSGDSGGPLFDMHGRVIGIHTRISESVAANFHAPVASYVANWDRLARGDNWGARGPRSRAWVGLRGADHPDGFRLDRVFAEGPADRAGLQEGDVVKRCNGQAVANYDAFLQALSGLRPGEKVRLGVARDDDEWEVELTVENRRRGPGPFGGSPSR
jgi:serine protease Do